MSTRKLLVAFVMLVVSFVAILLYISSPGPSIPFGTRSELASAMWSAFENPPTDIWSSRPGWSGMTPSPAMLRITSFGPEAVPVLIANVKNENEMMRLQSIEMLGTLRADAAVPVLVDALRYDDNVDDAFIIAKLAEITDHPRGYEFHRTWFDKETQQEATAIYLTWWQERQQAASRDRTKR